MERIKRPSGKQYRSLSRRVQKLNFDSNAINADLNNKIRNIKSCFNTLSEENVYRTLTEIPVERLSDAGIGIRVGALKSVGYKNIAQLEGLSYAQLTSIRGVGDQTASQTMTAVQNFIKATRKNNQVTISAERRTPTTENLIKSIYLIRESKRSGQKFIQIVDEYRPKFFAELQKAKHAAQPLIWPFISNAKRLEAIESINQLESVLLERAENELLSVKKEYWTSTPSNLSEAWNDYLEHSVEYYTILEECIGTKVESKTKHGSIPDKLVESIESQKLDSSLLKASLRGYQEFGAKFAIVQKRTLLGDEMGLGKTVEAIAAMAHLQVEGGRYFEVVCPASVLINWGREVAQHSELKAFRIHGQNRVAEMQRWIQSGGVAVTTFDMTRILTPPPEIVLDMLVVDEAHYAKNPEALRTQAIQKLAQRSKRVVFMTGTPLENRLEEMKRLIALLRPQFAQTLNAYDQIANPEVFRRNIAEVYLRRNREDVLHELPPLIEIEEWVEFGHSEEITYRQLVGAGHFMKMRRVAWTGESIRSCPKLERLMEICQDAKENGRKVVVFSFFLDVIARAHQALGEDSVEPITGSVSPIHRQEIIDKFNKARAGTVLVSQVQAGGVGMNIQKASVVIICEPQIKPALEIQAISRVYRMGQTNSVVVHRLLTEDSIDERMMEMLSAKNQIFDAYARESVIAQSSGQATDITERALIDKIISQEQKRLGLIVADKTVTDNEYKNISEQRVISQKKHPSDNLVTETQSHDRLPQENCSTVKRPENTTVSDNHDESKRILNGTGLSVRFCAYCGTRIVPEAKCCGSCGQKVLRG